MRRGLMVLCGLMALGLHTGRAADTPDPQPQSLNLSGQWQLNEKLSDDPVQAMEQMMRDGGEREVGRDGGRSGGRRGGMDDGMGGGPGDDSTLAKREKQRAQMAADMRKALSRLEIFHEGNEFNITDGRDLSQLLIIGAPQNTIWTERGEMIATAAYQGVSLVISLKPGRGGPALSRTYLLSEGGQRLTVIEERSLPRMDKPIRVRSVYDRIEPGAEPK